MAVFASSSPEQQLLPLSTDGIVWKLNGEADLQPRASISCSLWLRASQTVGRSISRLLLWYQGANGRSVFYVFNKGMYKSLDFNISCRRLAA